MKYEEFIIFLGTENLEKTSDFYLNKLNFSLYKDQGVCKIFHINEMSKIGFCSHMPVTIKDKSPILTFVTENVDEAYRFLIQKGVEIPGKPQYNEKFKIYHFFFRDPNSYTLEVQKFMD
jgi:catechol 2,3-dioxygenase-like lactoylglutathione lyase family enzyme